MQDVADVSEPELVVVAEQLVRDIDSSTCLELRYSLHHDTMDGCLWVSEPCQGDSFSQPLS